MAFRFEFLWEGPSAVFDAIYFGTFWIALGELFADGREFLIDINLIICFYMVFKCLTKQNDTLWISKSKHFARERLQQSKFRIIHT